jgi:hypothetical protein
MALVFARMYSNTLRASGDAGIDSGKNIRNITTS